MVPLFILVLLAAGTALRITWLRLEINGLRKLRVTCEVLAMIKENIKNKKSLFDIFRPFIDNTHLNVYNTYKDKNEV